VASLCTVPINVFKKKSSFPYILNSCTSLEITLSIIQDDFCCCYHHLLEIYIPYLKLFLFLTFSGFAYLGFIFCMSFSDFTWLTLIFCMSYCCLYYVCILLKYTFFPSMLICILLLNCNLSHALKYKPRGRRDRGRPRKLWQRVVVGTVQAT
jgi:hypothetical protein